MVIQITVVKFNLALQITVLWRLLDSGSRGLPERRFSKSFEVFSTFFCSLRHSPGLTSQIHCHGQDIGVATSSPLSFCRTKQVFIKYLMGMVCERGQTSCSYDPSWTDVHLMVAYRHWGLHPESLTQPRIPDHPWRLQFSTRTISSLGSIASKLQHTVGAEAWSRLPPFI